MSIAIHPPSEAEYTPRTALAEVLVQHATLRSMMDRCEALADALDEDRIGPLELARATARLRIAFTEHSELEERVLRPALRTGNLTEVEVDRMIAGHAREHRAMRSHLGMSSETQMLRAALESLRAHLDAEEQTLR